MYASDPSFNRFCRLLHSFSDIGILSVLILQMDIASQE